MKTAPNNQPQAELIALIEAVQQCNVARTLLILDAWKREQRERKECLVWMTRKVSEGLLGSGLTALHVACKCYSLAKSNEQRERYNLIVSMLLEHHANPFAHARVPGSNEPLTPIVACSGKLPMALLDELSRRAERYERDLYGPRKDWANNRTLYDTGSSCVDGNWIYLGTRDWGDWERSYARKMKAKGNRITEGGER